MPVLKVTGGVGRSYCLYAPLPSPSHWDHWAQDMGCSDKVSNDETNFNPMLSGTLFL